jgi:type I restriction enzyme M protein
MGKTNPLNDADMVPFIEAQMTFADTAQSWSVNVATVNDSTFDLSVKNPNSGEVVAHRSPQDIMNEIAALDAEAAEVLATIRELL